MVTFFYFNSQIYPYFKDMRLIINISRDMRTTLN